MWVCKLILYFAQTLSEIKKELCPFNTGSKHQNHFLLRVTSCKLWRGKYMWLHQSSLWERLRCVLLRENGTRLGEFCYQEGFSSLFTLMCKLPGTWGSIALALFVGRKLLSKATGMLIPVSLPQITIYCVLIQKRIIDAMKSHTNTHTRKYAYVKWTLLPVTSLHFHTLSRRLKSADS